jgi:hypothetical protein
MSYFLALKQKKDKNKVNKVLIDKLQKKYSVEKKYYSFTKVI